jgi:hypothetical protein
MARRLLSRSGVEGHARYDANAHAQLDIGLDHIGVDGFQQHVRLQAAQGKRVVDLAAAGEGAIVGDDRDRQQFLPALPAWI